MNGKAAKKFRKELKAKVKAAEENIAIGMKNWINALPFKDRFKIAFRIVRGRF